MAIYGDFWVREGRTKSDLHKVMKCRPGRLDMNPDPEVLGYPIDGLPQCGLNK
jgi:hypothetical protein